MVVDSSGAVNVTSSLAAPDRLTGSPDTWFQDHATIVPSGSLPPPVTVTESPASTVKSLPASAVGAWLGSSKLILTSSVSVAPSSSVTVSRTE